jgi:hypothetical protein
MSAVTLYRSVDGSLFETESEQLAYDAQHANKEAIDAFVDRHFPIPEPELLFNEDGSPKLNDKGEQEKKVKQNAARGPVRRALALWIAENA